MASPWRGPEAVEVVLAVRRDCRREHAAKALVDPKLQPNGGEKFGLDVLERSNERFPPAGRCVEVAMPTTKGYQR